MRRVKKLLKFIGVTLCVAPILSVAFAQQGGSQGDLLLEMQEMRREIAELRDMVERQQFQMRKLQRNQTASSPSVAAPDYSSSSSSQDQVNSSDQGSVDNTSLDQSSYQAPSYSQTGSELGTNRSTQAGGERVYADEESGRLSPPSNPNQEQIEERVITAPPMNNQSSSGYPPVIDRSIGAPIERTTSGTAVDVPTNGNNRPQTGNGVMTSTNLPSASDNSNRYGTATGQTRPNPIYRQPGQPQAQNGNPQARQPNQIVRPGGVVAIPPVSTLPSNRESEYGSDYASREAATTGAATDVASSNGISTALSEADYYRQGFDLMKQSNFDEAVEVFEKQLAAYPRGDSADDAHYWIAEAMYVSRNLDVAKKHLRTLIQEYPNSRRVPDAMLKTAYIEQQQGNQIEARILFQEIVNFFPKSDAAIAAKNRLADSD